MKKNELTKVKIEDFTRDGEGIGHIDGYTLFVKDSVIGDTVLARVTKTKKTYGYARVEKVLEASPARVRAACPVARRCGGCRFQECDYSAQLEWKRRYVADTLRKIGGIADIEVRPVIGMEEPFRYRNKAQYPIGMVKGEDGELHVGAGFYAGRTHSIIEVRDCLLTREANAVILEEFLAFLREFRIAPYDEATGLGLVRHLLIREGFATGEILVCPVINGKKLPHAEALVERLRAAEPRILEVYRAARGGLSAGQAAAVCSAGPQSGEAGLVAALCSAGPRSGAAAPSRAIKPRIASVCVNINETRGNVILGERTVPLYGEPYIADILGGLSFQISPRSFYQVNPAQTEKLYAEALRAAALTGAETVYDLYCGIGTISLFLARAARDVYGVEIVPDAVRDARGNAARNGVKNVHFYAGAAEELVVRGSFAPGVPCPPADVVVLDPPRKGCDAALIAAVLAMAPSRIVYVSCDPATLARDLALFRAGNGTCRYEAEYAQPVDLFGQTPHVETVALMSRNM